MKIRFISDTHGHLPEIEPCDVLVHAGDICPVDMPHDPQTQAGWLDTNFRAWLDEIPAEHVIGIAGNHDFVFEAKEHPRDMRWTYLCDSGCEIDGVKFWGTPWVPRLVNWAFCSDGLHWEAENTFDRVPSDLDVLISHGPPYRKADCIPANTKFNRGSEAEFVGCKRLLQVVKDKQPKFNVFGHIHEGGGVRALTGQTTHINASYLNAYYEPYDINPRRMTVEL